MEAIMKRTVLPLLIAVLAFFALPSMALADDSSQGGFTDFSVITEDGTETGYAGLFDARSAWSDNEGSTLKLYKDWGNLQFGLNCSGYRTIDLNGHRAEVYGSATSKCDGLIIKNGTYFVNGCKFQNNAGGTVVFENATLDASPGSEIINNGIFVLGQNVVRTDYARQFFSGNAPVQGLGDVTLDTTEYDYDGTGHEPAVTVKNLNGDTLTKDADYTVAYQNNVNAGTAKVIVTGIGNYGGPVFKTFTINPVPLVGPYLSDPYTVYTYTGKAIEPEVVVFGRSPYEDIAYANEGVDYDLAYTDNVNVGTATVTATGKGNYTGTSSVTFNIDPAVIASIELSGNTFTYTGKAIEPTVTMKDEDGNEFELGAGCTVSYENNVNAGTGSANVQFGGSFTGEPLSKEFQIKPAGIVSAKLGKTAYTYTGKALKPSVTVKGIGGKTLRNGTDYTVSYSANKSVGTAKATVSGEGNYTGTKLMAFVINPKGTSLGKFKAAKKSFTAKWSKQSGKMASKRIGGYQIRYSLSKSMGKAKTATAKGYKATSKTVKKLKAKKKYYVQVRTYLKADGKNYYSAWSKAKSVKTK